MSVNASELSSSRLISTFKHQNVHQRGRKIGRRKTLELVAAVSVAASDRNPVGIEFKLFELRRNHRLSLPFH